MRGGRGMTGWRRGTGSGRKGGQVAVVIVV